ncbi:alpha/beta hydrolase [Prochlorococcus marinus]|uniref:alpha/beta hydrolase n=1 Tax=Prochlorococcus marinus TaxID=1219 RepID=UPI0022B472B7|nr:alpha/beta hydrolase [Prochlorococcus marinus]
MKKNKLKKLLFSFLCITIFSFYPSSAFAAEEITLIKSIFSRTIYIKDLEDFITKGKAKGFLAKAVKNQNQEEIKNILKKRYKAPIELTSRLLYSEIGEVILKRISKILYPHRIQEESISILALKASAIKAIDLEDESISLIDFLKAYPSKVIAIDVTELSKVINKVESLNELVRFFSDSPLEKLKAEPTKNYY